MKTPTKAHDGRLALVTGAALGIGKAIAVALTDRGAQAIATDLKAPHETVSGRPGQAPTYAGTDFLIAIDGRMATVDSSFGQLP